MAKKKKSFKKRNPAKSTPSRGNNLHVQNSVTGQSVNPAELKLRFEKLLQQLPCDKELVKKSYLGEKQQSCRVCGASGLFQTWKGIEMMQHTRDEFPYFVCSNCNCLQIETVPENLGDYYEGGYYSYSKPPIVSPPAGMAPKNDYVLDVGCGGGAWLCEQIAEGYQYLFGCDPFIEQDIYYPNGVQIRKCTIHQMMGSFDLVRMGDSFEHVIDPLETMQSIKRLLKPDGTCILRLPIFPNAAFDVYGPYWYQMDPPRHIFLHSLKSLGYLVAQCGLHIDHFYGGNGHWPYGISALYQKDIPFPLGRMEEALEENFTKNECDIMKETGLLAAALHRSDHMDIFIKHS